MLVRRARANIRRMNAILDQHEALPVPFAEASIADAMNHGVIHCRPETPLRTVARMMATYNVHAVYVFDDRGLWGLVSDIDVAAAACGDLDGRTAGSSSVTPLLTVMSNQPLADAAELMSLIGATHLAVLDPVTRKPVGVVSTLDVVKAIAIGQGVREVQASA